MANIGIATDGLLALDVDGPDNAWLANQPEKQLDLAVAPCSLTANGGRQHLFRQPAERDWRNTTGKLAPHVDTRGNGGYIVAPPSVLDGGLAYRWQPGAELEVGPGELPEPPVWLIDELDALATARRRRTRFRRACVTPHWPASRARCAGWGCQPPRSPGRCTE